MLIPKGLGWEAHWVPFSQICAKTGPNPTDLRKNNPCLQLPQNAGLTYVEAPAGWACIADHSRNLSVRASFDCRVHLLDRKGRRQFCNAAFELRCGDRGEDRNSSIGPKKEPESIAWFEVQVFPHHRWDHNLIVTSEHVRALHFTKSKVRLWRRLPVAERSRHMSQDCDSLNCVSLNCLSHNCDM
jgi:hypothetical protein